MLNVPRAERPSREGPQEPHRQHPKRIRYEYEVVMDVVPTLSSPFAVEMVREIWPAPWTRKRKKKKGKEKQMAALQNTSNVDRIGSKKNTLHMAYLRSHPHCPEAAR